MSHLRNWSPQKVIKFLLYQGFIEVHSKKGGSHRYFKHHKLQAFTQVSVSKNPIPTGTFFAIIKQSKIDKQTWLNYK